MNMKNNELGSKTHTFVIAEAGSNWKAGSYEEDLTRSKELIKIASKAGADAIKFQTYRPETVYVPDAGKSNYLSKHGIDENINKIFENLSMPYEMIPELAKICESEKIMFMSTPFSVNDAKEVDPYVDVHKIASFEINHVRLLEFLAKTGKPLIISTGASTYQEIDFVMDLAEKNDSGPVVLLQCTSKYPATLETLNLSVIPKMKERYDVPIGLSDHSIEPTIAPLTAIGFGATVIEKHFTLDRNLPGPDHPFALNPEELSFMINSIRLADKAKGTGGKIILEDEKELQKFATRSIQAIKDISEGDILREGINFDILRPGNRIRGLEARFLEVLEGRYAVNNIKKGDGILDYK